MTNSIQRSKNETITILKKALQAGWRDKGVEPGTGAECAEALFLLESYGFDCCLLLDELLNTTSASIGAPDFASKECVLADIASHGPAAFDFVCAKMQPINFFVPEGQNPLLVVGLAATYGAVMPAVATFYLGDEREVIAPGDYILVRKQLDHIANHPLPLMVVIEPSPPVDTLRVKADGPLEIDNARWQKLTALAVKNHVPASEASRLTGAGAGLNDND